MFCKFFNKDVFTIYFNIFAPVTEKLFIKWRKCKNQFIPKVDLIIWWQVSWMDTNSTSSSYNCLTHEYWRLRIFEFMSTFLRPPFSKELHKFSFWFWESSFYKLRLFVFFVFFQLIVLRMRLLINCFENEVR